MNSLYRSEYRAPLAQAFDGTAPGRAIYLFHYGEGLPLAREHGEHCARGLDLEYVGTRRVSRDSASPEDVGAFLTAGGNRYEPRPTPSTVINSLLAAINTLSAAGTDLLNALAAERNLRARASTPQERLDAHTHTVARAAALHAAIVSAREA